MANRSIRGRRIIDDSSSNSDSDDEFPDLKDIIQVKALKVAPAKNVDTPVIQPEKPAAKSVRRRKLGAIADNPLLRPLGEKSLSTPGRKDEAAAKKKSTTPQRIELRTRKTKPVITSFDIGDSSEAESIHEETIVEDFSGSEFDASQSSDEEEDNHSEFGEVPQPSPSKSKGLGTRSTGEEAHREMESSPSPSAQLRAEAMEAEERDNNPVSERNSRGSTESRAFISKAESTRRSPTNDLAGPRAMLRL